MKKLNVTPETTTPARTLSTNAADKLAEPTSPTKSPTTSGQLRAGDGADSVGEQCGVQSLLQTGLKIFQRHQQHAEHVAAELK